MLLRALRDGDLEALVAIQRAHAGDMPPWTLAAARVALTDEANARGAHVRVAERDGKIVGAAGWVRGGDGEFYIKPLVATDGEVTGALVDACCETARGAAWIRVATGTRTSPIADALVARGFTPQSVSVTLSRTTADVAAPIAGWIALAGVDRDRLLDVVNTTFRGVPNSLPFARPELDEVLADVIGDATGVVERAGSYVGFVIARRHGDGDPHVEIDSIGVAEVMRGQGLGRALVGTAIAGAHRAGFSEIRALVSSLNDASMALHAGLGFTPKYRRHHWQRDR